MQIASQLIEFGANPEVVAENITDDVDNQFFSFSDLKPKEAEDDKEGDSGDLSISFKPTESAKSGVDPDDATALQISHGDDDDVEDSETEISTDFGKSKGQEETEEADKNEPEEPANSEPTEEASKETDKEPKEKSAEPAEEPADAAEPSAPAEPSTPDTTAEDPALLDELKATAASLSGVGAETAPTPTAGPVQLNESLDSQLNNQVAMNNSAANSPIANISTVENPTPNIPVAAPAAAPAEVAPVTEFTPPNRYSQMLEDALSEPATSAGAPMDTALPPVVNPAASVAPAVATTPEISSMPEINYGQSPDGQVLPPPPAPPVDINSPMPIPMPTDAAMTPPTPAMPTPPAPAAAPASADPSAFTIPGV